MKIKPSQCSKPAAADSGSQAATSSQHTIDPGQEPLTSTAGDIRRAAMNLLARREHSALELQQKLARRFAERDIIANQVQRLADENLQSNLRFVESFTRQRAQRGYGPVRIRQEMRERGLSDADISAALAAAELDWWALAEQAFVKKFGAAAATDIKAQARRVRFMLYRGFQREHFDHLLAR